MVGEPVPPESGTRARTRRAILDAAVSVLSRHSAASLAEVATAAGVGRTTMHRYFPERADLLAGIGADVQERIERATDRARPDEGPAAAALQRLCQSYFELGAGMLLVFNEPQLFDDAFDVQMTPADAALLQLVERGHAEGSLDRSLPPLWVQSLVWSLVYAAWMHTRTDDVPEHDALTLCLTSLRKAVAP